jgi:diguanylate cyclase (GGDEF)-like protein/PAS domain S-box-containing protein
MRKSRFAGVSDDSLEAVRPLSLVETMRFDFESTPEEDDERMARERIRSVIVSLPFLALSHLAWGAALLFALHSAGATLVPVALLLGGILSVDLGLCLLSRRPGISPSRIAGMTATASLASGCLWAVAAGLTAAGPAAGSSLAKAALVAGVGGSISAFFMIPGLLLISMLATLATVGMLKTEAPLVGIASAVGLSLLGLGLSRSRDMLFSAQRRLAAERQAKKARRFVTDFEESGRGWFWETNAEGGLTYVSDSLARHLGLQPVELLGRPFEELLLIEEDGEDEARRTLGFHLHARFPFAEVTVRASHGEDVWWSLSGSPNFDAYGRFLGFRGIGSNLSEQRRSEAETSKLARYDSLTGLPNRAMMRSTLDQALINAAARRRGCALMLIDLDRFKQVNDTLGHPVGDKLLKKVAARLAEVIGDQGQVGRLGGDEFEAILPGIEGEGLLSTLAQKLIAEVSRPYSIEGHRIVIGASVGIAIARPGKAQAEGLIKEADLALYAAKAAGRGTFRFFAEQMHAQATERQILQNELREALGRDQIGLLYQPIVDAVSEEAVAFEALIRWRHPTRGLLMPAVFLELAEEAGLMPRIGDWVLRTACGEAAKWPAHIRVAVNLSPGQFIDESLPATLTGALAASGLDPDRLELEISEAVFLADSKASERVLAGLKAIGVRIALDNFGTGHSGLGHLRNAPLDKIKIDRSFVRGAAEAGGRNAAIVRAIVVLAESLGMDTTAEGAETLDELALIRRLGCSQVQGFIFGKPMPAVEALALATQSRPTAEVVGFSRPPRHRLIRVGKLRWDDVSVQARVRNISPGGAMVECDSVLEPGTKVQLDLDEAGILDAEIRWCQRGQAGLAFAELFELRRLARTRPGQAGLKMLRPQYLEVQPEAPPPSRPAGPSPLAKKRARR